MRRHLDLDDLSANVTKADNGCWNFTGEIRPNGYGRFGRHGYAHRVYYERLVGPIPVGLEIDHLCRNRRCVNPAHLEAVSGRTNTLRSSSPAARNALKTHCSNGHEYTPENTIWRPRADRNPWRACRACTQEWRAISNARKTVA